jgi:DnaJ family protein C protein 9
MDEDPINNFFTSTEVEDSAILYKTLSLTSSATPEEIRRAYRKQSLRLHPDKNVGKSAEEKEELGRGFQRVGFAYAVLSDEAKRKRYVSSSQSAQNGGKTEQGWKRLTIGTMPRVGLMRSS